MVYLSKIFHHNEYRIRVDLPNLPDFTEKIRSIHGRTFSGSLRCWHVPYSKEAFQHLKRVFPQLIISPQADNTIEPVNQNKVAPPLVTIEKDRQPLAPSMPEAETITVVQPASKVVNASGTVRLSIKGNWVKIFLPKQAADTAFITALKSYQWIPTEKCWQLPAYPAILNKLHTYFGSRIQSIEQWPTRLNDPLPIAQPIDDKVWSCRQKTNGRVAIVAAYNPVLVAFIKKQPYPTYHSPDKSWTVAWHEDLKDAIEKLANTHNKMLIWEIELKENKGLPRPLIKKMANYQPCPNEYIVKLQQLNYTEASINNYVPLFEEFINYYASTNVADITPQMIEHYMQYLVVDRKFSTSSHRMAISAIKFYYERVQHKPKYTYFFEQPRSEKKLPVVLSKDEIALILEKTNNLKHKALLTLAYSSGLRVSEVINLKIADADLVRGTLHIQSGKGHKDRYSFLAKKCITVLQQYLDKYQPECYLFNGDKGEAYATRSAQEVFSQAVARAGINKDVKFHTLRHSFATHALENGTNLRIIQEILGHNSSKTTEIYTHVTQKTLHEFRNPLDQ